MMKNTNSFQLSAIVAMGENGSIGHQNCLPWHLPADLRHFKALTTGHAIIMGRKTYASIGKPLPNRVNIVISRDNDFQAPGCLIADGIESAITLAQSKSNDDIFIIGGAEIFQATLPLIHRLYLTIIHHSFPADVFFPSIDEDEWQTISVEDHHADAENAYDFSFVVMERVGI